MKCSNNLGTIVKAYNAYSSDDDGQAPHLSSTFAPIWRSSDHTRRAHALGYEIWSAPLRGNRWMQAFTIRQSLSKLAVISSPLDQKKVARLRRYSIKTFDQWRPDRFNQRVSRVYQSHAIAMQGDLEAFPRPFKAMPLPCRATWRLFPDHFLGLTRNVRGGG